MKKFIKTLSVFAFAFIAFVSAVSFVLPDSVYAETSYTVAGYSETISFNNASDINMFSVTGEHGDVPYILDGKLVLPNTGFMYCAQKNKSYSGDTEVIVPVIRLFDATNPHISAGVYVRSDSTGKNAWCVNMGANANAGSITFSIGQVVDCGLSTKVSADYAVAKDFVLRIVIKNNVLYLFINNQASPLISYNIGSGSGGIGFRGYYSATGFDYITVTNSAITAKPATYNAVLNKAKAIDQSKLTSSSKTILSSSISALENATNQEDLDIAGKNLEKVVSEVIYKRTESEMALAISRAEAIENPNGAVYTANSYNSLVKVLAYCKTISPDGEDEYSIMCTRLEQSIANLVCYIGG